MPLTHCLPQDDRRPDDRAAQLARAREAYRYAYDWPVGVATLEELPRSEQYGVIYTAKTLRTYLTIGANLAEMAVEGFETGTFESMIRERFENAAHEGVAQHLLRTPQDLAAHAPNVRVKTWSEFEELYQVWAAPDVVSFFHRQPADLDAAFAWQRIAGVNPMTLARCTELPDRFPVTDAMVKAALGEGDGLEAAAADGRLYLADYAALDGIETGVTDGLQKHMSAPLALFGVDRSTGTLRPVAIQAHQTPSATNPVWTPRDGWRWWMARNAVQIADASVHEGFTHLGRTHMVMEAVNLALHRCLAERHPLHVLLVAHLETTSAINHSAKTSLIAPGGTVDRCFAPKIEAFAEAVKGGLDTYRLDQTDPRRDLAARGLDDTTALPTHPYRDDVLDVWDALEAYLTEYVDLYYDTDADVAADTEVQAFVAELGASEGGRLKGVPRARDKAGLIYLLTRLIFIAGPQHSAVNFPQFPNMGYPPNMPGASYTPVFAGEVADDEAAFTAMLPPWRIAIEDTTMVYLLSNVRNTRLGHYAPLHFTDPRVLPVLHRFQRALEDVETAITVRDRDRLISYPHLRPSLILQSISI